VASKAACRPAWSRVSAAVRISVDIRISLPGCRR